ncbi:MAG TPA: HNH endonuclease signature motif containing protein [Pseudonocardia sp.]
MNPPGDCIPWTGRINEFGYGTIGIHLAHRRAWEEARGPIPAGMTLDHLCHDPELCKLGKLCPHRRCVNPDHLKPVTADENRRRSSKRGSRVSHCRQGHEYAGENLVISKGERYCRACQREKRVRLREARWEASAERCRAAGHERVVGVGPRGRRLCVICRSELAKKQPRNGSYFGRSA